MSARLVSLPKKFAGQYPIFSGKSILKYHCWFGAGLLALGLAACAESPAPAKDPSHATSASLRLVIRFARADRIWTDSDLTDLRTHFSLDISPVAAVSNTAWAYRLVPRPGQDMNEALKALRARPEVTQVDLDAKVKNP